ncbi:MAG: NADH:ubiquinone reductase (Na(+)-transporting) subunit C [Tannerella sp.]|jgi:Na+-transporting NADH:ubiquinone oxidoreductase subunit C|nr:NADH:ubiquinone reductase (Na(+)-transporting) subunit C [Tannerella sp.]
MSKYKCKVCGYIHEGDNPPAQCPICKAPASEFELISDATGSPASGKKKLDTNGNAYTILYATAMVVVVALLLAFTSQSLRSIQKTNEENDKRQQILRSINVRVTAKQAEAKYDEFIEDDFMVDANGRTVGDDAFTEDVAKAFDRGAFPVFVAKVDGKKKYILAMRGAGLWGPLWGYIALDDDCNTVFGADFSHASETPGLGAEIAKEDFSRQFIGKHFFKDEQFRSISVLKKGKQPLNNEDYVDGISGGTITSNGVNAMISASIGNYSKFLTSKKQ